MNNRLTSTNVSFSFLEGSSDFMNLVLNNINSCVMLLNHDMELQAFNDVLKTVFSNRKDEDLLYLRCGEALGCSFNVDEAKDCGTTSQCCTCELRISALTSYTQDQVIYKEHIVRPFYNQLNQKVDKHLQFSTRLFRFMKDKYIIMLVEDVSKFYEKK